MTLIATYWAEVILFYFILSPFFNLKDLISKILRNPVQFFISGLDDC